MYSENIDAVSEIDISPIIGNSRPHSGDYAQSSRSLSLFSQEKYYHIKVAIIIFATYIKITYDKYKLLRFCLKISRVGYSQKAHLVNDNCNNSVVIVGEGAGTKSAVSKITPFLPLKF